MNKWTKKRIIDAFSMLVYKYGYDDITVEMILKEAEVSKTTFYRYFRDKADVMDARFRSLYDEAILERNCQSLQDLFEILIEQAKENDDQYAMFSTTGHNSYREFVYRYTYEMGKRIIETVWNRKVTESEDFHIAYFCAGGAKMLQEWVRGRAFTQFTTQQFAHEMTLMMSGRYRLRFDDVVREHIREIIEKGTDR
ncbi:MAG: TetR/AcrR family transcriptional regulator [Solobacterium sp.]|nr:TetR/AcrR family transcriptional regulator [Solobacterium sp.]